METIKGPAAPGSDSEVVRVMRAARARLAAGWCQGKIVVRDAAGTPIAWCLVGAFTESLHTSPAAGCPACACSPIFRELIGDDFGKWNDAPGRTQAEVLAVVDKAIAKAEGRSDPKGPSALASDSTSEGDDP